MLGLIDYKNVIPSFSKSFSISW